MWSSSRNSEKLRRGRNGHNCPPFFLIPCRPELPVNYLCIAFLPLGVIKQQRSQVSSCLQRPTNRIAHQARFAKQFSTITMDHCDHNPGLQGTPRELVTAAAENPLSVGVLPLEAPADNMGQVNWGMNEVSNPSLEPIDEGAGMSTSMRHMADLLPISASGIRHVYVGYLSRDTQSHRSLILSSPIGP